MTNAVHGHVTVNAIGTPLDIEAAGVQKPFLKLTFPDGTVIQITTNLAEKIGWAGAGVRKRHEDMIRRAHS
jgi:hypothetical protein